MIYNWASAKSVIATVDRNYKPGISGWINDAMEWIGEVIEIAGVAVGMQEVVSCREVENYRTKLPCDMEQLTTIVFKSCQLPRTGQTNFASTEVIGSQPITEQDIVTQNEGSDSDRDTKQTRPLTDGDYYTISGPYIKTSFPTGTIYIHYKQLICDDDGFPMVPDIAEMRLAMADYIVFRLRGRGFRHPIFSNLRWDEHERQIGIKIQNAANEANMPDHDEMELIKNLWSGHNKSSNMHRSFYGLRNSETNKRADDPGTLYVNPYGVNRKT